MKILLVSATKMELLPLLVKHKFHRRKDGIYIGSVGGIKLEALITGIGMTATAFALGQCINAKYDLAINVGVAGSFTKKLNLGDVVLVNQDCFADLGAEDGEKYFTAADLKLMKSVMVKPVPSRLPVRFTKVHGITVNTVHGNSKSITAVIRKFKPDVESMEGAAFFYACQKVGMPSIQLRAISNYVERRNKKSWKLDLAVKNLNTALAELLQATS